jgi:hypothetical protein
LRKRIANDFNKATPFCNAGERTHTDLRFSVQRRSFVQAGRQLPHLPATGITAYLLNGGSLENAQAIATHDEEKTRNGI